MIPVNAEPSSAVGLCVSIVIAELQGEVVDLRGQLAQRDAELAQREALISDYEQRRAMLAQHVARMR